jgi:hypothetical protein
VHLAYVDAGSGSMITQVIVAGAAGAVVVARVGWRRLTAPFKKKQKSPEAPAE